MGWLNKYTFKHKWDRLKQKILNKQKIQKNKWHDIALS